MTLFAALLSLAAAAGADSPPSAAEIRQQRWFREERPWWREALALPADALCVLSWPLKETILWMEKVNLPARVEDAASAPFRRTASEKDQP